METKKDENYWKILNSALELDVKKGHLKWTLSDLSRKSGVTRSLIYYYFGRSKNSILEEGIKLIGTELAGLNPNREKMWSEGDFVASLTQAREVYNKAPYLGIFINEHIGRDTETGDAVRKVKTGFQRKIDRFFKTEGKAKSKAIFAIYWGLLFAPEQSEETYQVVAGLLKSLQK